MGIVIDTSALVALERSSDVWERSLSNILSEPAVIPAIVYAELLVGAKMAKNPDVATRRRLKIDALVSRVPIVEFTAALAGAVIRFSNPVRPGSRDGARSGRHCVFLGGEEFG